MSTVVYQTCTNFVGLFHFKALLTMSRPSSNRFYEADEDFMLSEQPDMKVEEDEAEFSLQPYLFEPTRKLSSSMDSDEECDDDAYDSDSSSDDEGRLNNLEWQVLIYLKNIAILIQFVYNILIFTRLVWFIPGIRYRLVVFILLIYIKTSSGVDVVIAK